MRAVAASDIFTEIMRCRTAWKTWPPFSTNRIRQMRISTDVYMRQASAGFTLKIRTCIVFSQNITFMEVVEREKEKLGR